IQVVCIGVLPGLATSTKPLADAGARVLGPGGGTLLAVGALVSAVGTLGGTLLAGSRLLFALGERGDLPTILARTDPRRHTPSLAILLTSAAALLLTLTGTFNYTITLNVISRLLVFLCTAVALLVFRGRRTAPPARLRLPGGPALAVVTCAACLWLLGSSG